MRRRTFIVTLLVAALLLAGCSDDGSSDAGDAPAVGETTTSEAPPTTSPTTQRPTSTTTTEPPATPCAEATELAAEDRLTNTDSCSSIDEFEAAYAEISEGPVTDQDLLGLLAPPCGRDWGALCDSLNERVGGPGAATTTPPGPTTTATPSEVVYEILGGPTSVSLTFQTPGGVSQEAEVAVPLTRTEQTAGMNGFLYVSAQIMDPSFSGTITCRITVAGRVIAEVSATGFPSIAQCSS